MKQGDAIAPFERTLTRTDLVAYAGATWDWHPLHHDDGFLAAKGIDRPVVDGQMLGALMAAAVRRAAGPRAFISALSIRYRAMVFAGENVIVEGEVVDVGETEVRIALRARAGERIVAEGEAVVRP